MKFSSYKPIIGIAAMVIVLANSSALAASNNGNAESYVKFSKMFITISDPDGLNWYGVYTSAGKEVKSGNGQCEETVKLEFSTAQAYTVRFTDCSGGKEQWSMKVAHGTPVAGKRVKWTWPKKAGASVALQVGDFNLDGLTDVVVAQSYDGGVTVSIMDGNGDGSLNAPDESLGQVIRLNDTGVSIADLPGDDIIGTAFTDSEVSVDDETRPLEERQQPPQTVTYETPGGISTGSAGSGPNLQSSSIE